MIITKLDGGLGNQLFQYAVGKHAAMLCSTEFKFDLTFFNEQNKWPYELIKFCIDVSTATNDECLRLKYRRPSWHTRFKWALFRQPVYPYVPARSYVREQRLNTYDASVFSRGSDLYLDGLWQTEKYFLPIADQIRAEVQLRDDGSDQYRQLREHIARTSAVSIHVRRGDYVNHSVFAVLPLSYYAQAIDHIRAHIESPTFFVFSNDLPWCRENLPVPAGTVFVGGDQPLPPHEDLMLMSQCRHHIIANSTFSWWGAWLNPDPDKIVCTPARWHCNGREIHDTLPEQWLRFEC